MKLGNQPKFQKLHLYSLSTLVSQTSAYFRSSNSGFRDTGRFSNCHIWPWNLDIGQNSRSCTDTPFLPIGSKLSLFSLYGQRFLTSRPIFKIAIFGHKTWQSAKVPEVAQTLLFYPLGRNWGYFRSTGSHFWDTDQFSKLPYLGIKLDNRPKFQKLHIYSLSTLVGWNWAYCRFTGSSFWDTGRFWKLPYLGMKFGHWRKFQNLNIYSLYYPRVPNFTPFCSMAGHFQHIGSFTFSHWPQC